MSEQPMKTKTPRDKCYTLLAVGKKQLAMDEGCYRKFLVKQGATKKNGRISASTMTIGQLETDIEA